MNSKTNNATIPHRSRAGLAASVLCCLLGGGLASTSAVANPGSGSSRPGYCVVYMLMGGVLPPECRQQEPLDETEAQLELLTRAMIPFFSFDVAKAAGWDAQLSECVESPAGGMGYHYGNIDQLSNGSLSLLRPEALLYIPMEDGSMEFVGAEYIIPGPAWPHAEPPRFLNQDLHYNPVQEIWALHVWVGKHNPDGMFAAWNPEVSCEFAQ